MAIDGVSNFIIESYNLNYILRLQFSRWLHLILQQEQMGEFGEFEKHQQKEKKE